MRIEVVDNLSQPVGALWKDRQRRCIEAKNSFTIAASLSSTPLPVYEWVLDHASEFAQWAQVSFVLMDEQLEWRDGVANYVSVDDAASYEGFARRHFLQPLNEVTGIELALLKPSASEVGAYDVHLDLVILALGVDGNYANVMPGTPLNTGWHVATLLSEFRDAHTNVAGASYAGAIFREKGMSLGPQQIIAAEEVVVIASGEKKRSLVSDLLAMSEFDPAFPLSIVHDPTVQSKTTVFVTHDAMESV